MRLFRSAWVTILLAVGCLGQPLQLNKLIADLSSRDVGQRRTAAGALEQAALLFGPAVNPAIPALIRANIGDGDMLVKNTAGRALTALGLNPLMVENAIKKLSPTEIAFYLEAAVEAPEPVVKIETLRILWQYVNYASLDDLGSAKICEWAISNVATFWPPSGTNPNNSALGSFLGPFAQTALRDQTCQAKAVAVVIDIDRKLVGIAPQVDRMGVADMAKVLDAMKMSDTLLSVLDPKAPEWWTWNVSAAIRNWPGSDAPLDKLQADTLKLAMSYLSGLPGQRFCEFPNVVPLIIKLGSYAAPARPKLLEVAGHPDSEWDARCGPATSLEMRKRIKRALDAIGP
jgi:hypothetical protein